MDMLEDPIIEALDLPAKQIEGDIITLSLISEAMGPIFLVSPCQLSMPITSTPLPGQEAEAFLESASSLLPSNNGLVSQPTM
jgi:hypothetical protein